MAVNRYDTPAQAKFMNTYVPIPFEQLYTMGRQAKEDIDKATNALNSTMQKWYEFRSPSEVDTKRFYDETLNKAAPIINEMTSNPDAMKSAEWRSKMMSTINNVDYATLAMLQQSRDQMLAGQEYRRHLALNGKFDPNWHDVDYSNYDTAGSIGNAQGIFSDISPLAYSSVKDMTDKYFNNLDDSYLRSDGGYDYSGVNEQTLVDIANKNRTGILATPEAQKHIEVQMRLNPGLSYEDAEDWLMSRVVADNREYIRERREVNPFALENLRAANVAARRSTSGSGSDGGIPPMQFIDRLTYSMFDGRNPDPNTGDPGKPSPYAKYAGYVAEDSPFRKVYVTGSDTTGTPIAGFNRAQSANGFLNDTFVDIGSYAEDINQTQFVTKPFVGLRGQTLYSGTGIQGIEFGESYVNLSMGMTDANQMGWGKEKAEFVSDLREGNIQGLAVHPTNRALLTNFAETQDASGNVGIQPNNFDQEYRVYVPVKYIAEKLGIKYTGSDESYEKLQKNDKFKEFVSQIQATPASTTGDIIERSSMQLQSETTNYAYDTDDTGMLWSRDTAYNVAKNFDGKYYEVRAVRPVLNNSMLIENVNRQEYLDSKLGTTSNVEHRYDNILNTHGLQ